MDKINLKIYMSMLKNLSSSRLNPRFTGYEIKETGIKVKKDEIIAFAKATRDENPLYLSDNPPAPPLYIAKLMIPMMKKIWCEKKLGMNLLRMVHAFQEVIWHKPVYAGDILKIKMLISAIKDSPAGELLEITTKAFVEDSLAVTGITGIIIRKRKKGRKKNKKKEKENLKEKFRLTINTHQGQPVEYAKASGDNNFIHTNRLLAKMAGLPGTIMHGACIMSMICSKLTEKTVNNDIWRLRALKGRFSVPVMPGEKLFFVAYEWDKPDEIPFTVLNSKGKPVFTKGMFIFNNRKIKK